jgi:hypothetical protein
MAVPEALEIFIRKHPLPVMVRAVLERAFCDSVLDQVFACFARKQRPGKLLLSTCVSLMASVVTRVQPTLGAACRSQQHLLPVGRDCVYDKIAGLEDEVVSGALAVTAADLAQLVDELHGALPSLIPGLRMLVLDGNHLRSVQHRLKALRGVPEAALPGTCVALLDADRKLFVHTFLLQDGHASEMQVLPEVAAVLQENDLLLADRNLGTRQFAAAVEDCGAFFLLRQHSTRFPVEPLGERVFCGESATGRVYEQPVRYRADGEWRTARRITVELRKATRNGDQSLHLLTNLPAQIVDPSTGEVVAIDGCTIAEAYRRRWSVENAFHTLSVELHCELNALGYPPAALFGFCVAAMCYNAYSAATAALRGHFGAERVEREFSTYYMANEIRSVWAGMNATVDDENWTRCFGQLNVRQLAEQLLSLAQQIDPQRYRKAPTRPRSPPTTTSKTRPTNQHTSVIKELNKYNAK